LPTLKGIEMRLANPSTKHAMRSRGSGDSPYRNARCACGVKVRIVVSWPHTSDCAFAKRAAC